MDTPPGPPAGNGPFSAGAVDGGTVRLLTLHDVPAGATAVALTVTAVSPSRPTYLSVCPGGAAPDPGTRGACGSSSTVNASGPPVANGTTVALGGAAHVQVEVFNAVGHVDVVVDVSGYYV